MSGIALMGFGGWLVWVSLKSRAKKGPFGNLTQLIGIVFVLLGLSMLIV